MGNIPAHVLSCITTDTSLIDNQQKKSKQYNPGHASSERWRSVLALTDRQSQLSQHFLPKSVISEFHPSIKHW
jgi:hypothetical protein